MKPGAVLINTGSWRLVDQTALGTLWRRGDWPARAWTCSSPEPLAPATAAHLPNVVVTPHSRG